MGIMFENENTFAQNKQIFNPDVVVVGNVIFLNTFKKNTLSREDHEAK